MWSHTSRRLAGHAPEDTSMHSSTRWLLGEIAVIAIVIALFSIAGYPQFLPYGLHLLLHIVGAVLFLGNILFSAVWLALAERTKEAAMLHFAARVVSWADVVFTAPGIVLLANGLIM